MSSLTGQVGYNGGVAGPTGKVGNKLPSGYKYGQIQQFDPMQMEAYKRYEQQIGPESYLSRLAGGDQSLFEEIEQPALKQFAGLRGSLASQFSGKGMGGRRSSAFQNAQTTAAQDFAKQLQAQRQGLQRQATQDLRGMTNEFLGYRPYEQFQYEKRKSPWGTILGKLFGPGGGLVGDIATKDKSFSGTQVGADTSLDMLKAFINMAGKSQGGG